jgi:hypothetical protein
MKTRAAAASAVFRNPGNPLVARLPTDPAAGAPFAHREIAPPLVSEECLPLVHR